MNTKTTKSGDLPRPELIPQSLTERHQWVAWKYSFRDSGGRSRMCKVPVSPTSKTTARSDSPETWSDFQTAWAYYEANRRWLAGVGYVFSPDDPFVGIDLDSCRDHRTGCLAAWAEQIVRDLDSYTEVSPSGTGLKVILMSDQKVPSRRRSSPEVEVYSSHRFFTITGHALPGLSRVENRTTEISQIHAQLFPEQTAVEGNTVNMEPGGGGVSDEEILKRAFTAGNRDKFLALWKGSLEHHAGNHSQADLSLCRILAFWVGPYPDQIDRIFRRSALFRAKWDKRHFANGSTYGDETIRKAIMAQGKTYYAWRQKIA